MYDDDRMWLYTEMKYQIPLQTSWTCIIIWEPKQSLGLVFGRPRNDHSKALKPRAKKEQRTILFPSSYNHLRKDNQNYHENFIWWKVSRQLCLRHRLCTLNAFNDELKMSQAEIHICYLDNSSNLTSNPQYFYENLKTGIRQQVDLVGPYRWDRKRFQLFFSSSRSIMKTEILIAHF